MIEHYGPDCPQCQAASQTCAALAGFAETMEKMIADGTFERLGRVAAERMEKAFLAALVGRATPAD